jgi:ribosomal protein L11 methyltransferase
LADRPATSGAGRASNDPGATTDRPSRDDGRSAGGTWLELAVAADAEAVEAVSEILTRYAPGGTTVEPAFELVDDGLGARLDPSRPSIVRAYLPATSASAARAAVDGARGALGHLQAFGLRPIGELETRVVHEDDWAEAWKAHFPVLRVGRRLVIRPTWRRHRRRAADVVLALDPGMAFGTGLHPTTRLCLAGLEDLADRGILAGGSAADGTARVLDVGCGSGILAIAAARLGAGAIVGVDPDPIAVEASRANARRNRLARRIRVLPGSVPTGAGPFDVVVANLIASLLVDLAPALVEEVVPGGSVLASGIFVDREAEVREAFGAQGLRVLRRSSEGDWVALEAVRPSGRAPGRPAVGSARPRVAGELR